MARFFPKDPGRHSSRSSSKSSPQRRVKIRHSSGFQYRSPLCFHMMHRHEALHHIKRCLEVYHLFSQARHLVELFQIEPEELTEAGVRYETLKAFERRFPLIQSFRRLSLPYEGLESYSNECFM